MKKMLLATALAQALQDVLYDVYCSKQTGSSSDQRKPSPIIFVSELGRRIIAAKICGGAENVVKQKPSKHS